MRPLVWGLVLVLFLVLQATVLPLVAIGGVRPDIMLIATISTGLLLGREHGVGLGFFAGLLQDLASGNVFGLNLLAKTTVGYMSGLMERKVFKENILLPLLAVMLGTALHSAVSLFILFAGGYKVDIAVEMANTLYLVGYNAVVAIPVHRLIFLVARAEMPDPKA
jgi:rod shape-determining protein MreD